MKAKFEEFDGYSSHRPLLYVALMNTGGKIVEMGSGEGSTPLINEMSSSRGFFSFESNSEWFAKMSNKGYPIFFIKDWQNFDIGFHVGLLFIDHAPGERRKIDIDKYRNKADVIIVHDTELSADHGYQMSTVLNSFKYRIDFRPEGFAHTTAVSETIDVSKWKI